MSEDIGKLVLRLNIGILMLFHGFYKVIYGIDGVKGMMEGMGFPSFFGYGVYLGEILAPIMLILGFRVKLASVLIILTMLMAIFVVTSGDIFGINQTGGWIIELQGLYLFGALSILFLGSGRFAFDIKKGK
ncbi:hypothetical protein BKH41_09020 [Helicobacter sp. 12S02232-10]|uniref:DoxX family protein n=1 Tax=Helicobacter sp. 12S02232-10 TaxID=1476197 RepID=UPI000BA64C17|nr:DoxX family protein [Helicobacter sp. 12S02232-10]PAF46586.1 hypothetical protein BKH41_09020 [Helicobacter sp. 12S02232-10]